jgi:hypothetical protein
MTLVSIPSGLLYPMASDSTALGAKSSSSSTTLDAATEKVAMIGRVYINGRPGSAKTISAAGGGSISFRTAAVTFANAGTTIDLGIQDVDAVNGVIARPDGSFDVSRTLTGGTDTINANAWNTFAMTGGTGSKSITHGDLIAVVFDMTARGGADSAIVTLGGSASGSMPVTNQFVAAAWATSSAGNPNVLITFDDGTLGIIDNAIPFTSALSVETFADGTNPDERGIIFQVPWDCKIDAIWANVGISGATSDYTITLYSTPTGTPAAVSGASFTVLAEQNVNVTAQGFNSFTLPAEVTLTRNTDYAIAIKADGAGNVRLNSYVLADTSHRAFLPYTSIAKATRNNGSGAFTAESPAITIYQMCVRISALQDTSSAGGVVGVIGG